MSFAARRKGSHSYATFFLGTGVEKIRRVRLMKGMSLWDDAEKGSHGLPYEDRQPVLARD